MKETPIQPSSGSTTSPLVMPGGMIADKYRLDALVGEGGMGSVWSATHVGLNQVVAIKFVSREFVRSEEALRRFDAEAKAAAQLRSRHVVQVFDSGTLTDGTPYIAMELLRGQTLQARVHEGGPVPLGDGVEILSQCCKALARAHAAGIIHRDIKPENIFLTQPTEDEGSIVKILDFGIAKMSVSPSEHGSKQGATRTGAVLGTPLYMSPEQARALRTLDQRTDLYSLGLVAYTMFTGNLAFSSESFGDLLLQICTAPLPSLCANAAWLPLTMEAWFQRACAREAQDRFASAQQFADALRLAAGMTLQERASSLAPNRAAFRTPGDSSRVAGPALASSPGTGPGISRTDDPIGPPPGTEKRWQALAMVGAALVVLGGAAVAAFALSGRSPNAAVRAAASSAAAAGSSGTRMAAVNANAGPSPSGASASAAVEASAASTAAPALASAVAPAASTAHASTSTAPSPPPRSPPPLLPRVPVHKSPSALPATTVDLGY